MSVRRGKVMKRTSAARSDRYEHPLAPAKLRECFHSVGRMMERDEFETAQHLISGLLRDHPGISPLESLHCLVRAVRRGGSDPEERNSHALSLLAVVVAGHCASPAAANRVLQAALSIHGESAA